MTLNISVVGKFHENSNDLYDKTDSILYQQMDEDDPNILSADSSCEVLPRYRLLNYYYIFYIRTHTATHTQAHNTMLLYITFYNSYVFSVDGLLVVGTSQKKNSQKRKETERENGSILNSNILLASMK